MATPSFLTEASAAGNYPAFRFNQRERKLLASVNDYIDGLLGAYKIVAAGSFTTVGGDANEAITVSGALASDIAIVVLHTAGATPRTILTAQAASNAINLVFSGDPSTDHAVRYILVRAGS